MPIDRATIVHVADLARIGLTEDEIERFTGQLSVVLDAVERLKTVNTSEISPTASTLPLIGVQRDDVVRPGLTTEEALANAPKGGRDGEFFRVQEILEGR
jgi:aspartyl-tRNA(Asn)/glutamyl-tRNA(Gln) amidotransferase subunit C